MEVVGISSRHHVGLQEWMLYEINIVSSRNRFMGGDKMESMGVNKTKRSSVLPSTLLISPAPKPVKVLLCLGRLIPAGPIGPWRWETGALVEGRRSRGMAGFDMMLFALSSGVSFGERKALYIYTPCVGTIRARWSQLQGLYLCYLVFG